MPSDARARGSPPSAGRSRPGAASVAARRGRRAGSAARRRHGAGASRRAGRCRRSRPGTSGTPASSAIRAAPECARASRVLRSPFCRRVPSGNITTTCPSRQSRLPSRSPPCPARPRRTGNAAGRGDDLLRAGPEELRLGHEAEVAPREERHAERPRVEVRPVVGGERRSRRTRARAPSRSTAAGTPPVRPEGSGARSGSTRALGRGVTGGPAATRGSVARTWAATASGCPSSSLNHASAPGAWRRASPRARPGPSGPAGPGRRGPGRRAARLEAATGRAKARSSSTQPSTPRRESRPNAGDAGAARARP